MRIELYKKIAERYIQKVENYPYNISSSFSDVAGNLSCSMGCVARLMREEGITAWKKSFMLRRHFLREYINLIQRCGEFRDAELLTEGGYFPDIRRYVYSSEGIKEQKKLFGEINTHIHHVMLCKQKLEKICSLKMQRK